MIGPRPRAVAFRWRFSLVLLLAVALTGCAWTAGLVNDSGGSTAGLPEAVAEPAAAQAEKAAWPLLVLPEGPFLFGLCH